MLTGVPAPTVGGVSNQVLVRKAAKLDVAITPSPSNVREGTSFTVRMRVTNAGQSEAEVTAVSLRSLDPSLVKVLHGIQRLMVTLTNILTARPIIMIKSLISLEVFRR